MREVLGDIARWRARGTCIAIARVVRVEGPGPRDVGAAMIVSEDGQVAGSVSGGCVEGAVLTEALDALASGKPNLVRFGYSDADAFAVGLSCGGVVTVYVAPELPAVQQSLEEALAVDEPVVLATVISLEADRDVLVDNAPREALGPASCIELREDLAAGIVSGATLLLHADGRVESSISEGEVARVVARDASGSLSSGRSFLQRYEVRAPDSMRIISVFYEAFIPPPRMIIFGAVDYAGALVKVGKTLGYRVTVCDAREPFATRERFPLADLVTVDWPDRYLASLSEPLGPGDAVCVLTHDAKFDIPAICGALQTDVGYIGALGSRRTKADRERRLLEAGVTDEQLARVMAPIGLDLGARTPEETAIAICAEIIARQTGHRPVPLRESDGPIHGGRSVPVPA